MNHFQSRRLIAYGIILLLTLCLTVNFHTHAVVQPHSGMHSDLDMQPYSEETPIDDVQDANTHEQVWIPHLIRVDIEVGDGSSHSYIDRRLWTEPTTIKTKNGKIRLQLWMKTDDVNDFESHLSEIRATHSAHVQVNWYDTIDMAGGETVYELLVDQIQEQSQLHIGALPALLLQDTTEPVVKVTVEKPEFIQLLRTGGISSSILARIPLSEETIVLRFSDAMSPDSDIRFNGFSSKNVVGHWLDPHHYEIKLDANTIRLPVDMDNLLTVDGRTVSAHPGISFHRIPDRSWHRYPDGEEVGFSPNDRYYDYLVFSPDHNKYVGMTDIWLAIHDGEGLYHLTLEREGKDAVDLMVSGYTDGFSLRWLDNDRLLYWDRHQLYLFDTRNDSTEPLLPIGRSHEIRQGSYDEYQDIFTASVRTMDSGWNHTYGTGTLLHVSDPSNRIYQYESTGGSERILPDKAVDGGVFQTFQFKGQSGYEQNSVFVDNTGTSYEQQGTVLMTHNQGGILEKREPGKAPFYYLWLALDRILEPITPISGYNIRPFGDLLIAVRYAQPAQDEHQEYPGIMSKEFMVYHFETKEWRPALTGLVPWVLYQTIDTLYRLDKITYMSVIYLYSTMGRHECEQRAIRRSTLDIAPFQ